LVFEDLPAPDAAAFGTLGSVWFGSARGLKAVDLRSLDADGQGQVKRALAIMTSDLAAQVTLRAFDQGEPDAKQAEGRRRLAKAIARVGASRNEVLQPIADLSERLSPQVGEAGTRFADLGRPAPADGQQRAVVGATNAPVAGPTGPVAGGP